jgi:hypothetical protein
MKRLGLSLFLGFLIIIISGQQKLTGRVLDENEQSIPYANILLLGQKDSTFYAGTICNDEGKFSISKPNEEVFLRVTATGYQSIDLALDVTTDFGTITLNPVELEEVTVKASTQLFASHQGNVVVNVANTLLSYSSSVQEIISKSPGLSVTTDGVEVIGKGEAFIFVNGQKTTWSSFKSIPVSQIKSIEIIKNPDATYDAEGMSIIQVTLLNAGLEGIKANVLMNYTKGFYHLGYVDVSLSYHKGKISINSGVNNNIGATGGQSIRTFDINSSSPAYTAINQYKEKVYLRNVPNWLLGMQYAFDAKKTASIQYNGSYAYFDLDVDNQLNRSYDAMDSTNQIISEDKAITEDYSHSISGNYRQVLDTLDSYLFVGATYNLLSTRYNDTILETLSSGEDWTQVTLSQSSGGSINQVQGGQVDWVKNGVKGTQFKLGAKYTASSSNSTVYILNNLEGDTTGLVDDHYNYEEALSAGYFSYYHPIKKGDLQFGLRTEQTSNKALVNGTTYLDTNYFSFFPNARLKLDFDKFTLIESFTSRIQRPRFADITPYTYYINSFSRVTGNPKILPSMVYSLESKLIRNNFDASLGAAYTKKPRVFVALADDITGAITFQAVNLKEMYNAYVEMGYTLTKGVWTSSNVCNVSYAAFFDDEIDIAEVSSSVKLYLFSYNRLKVSKSMTVELTGRFVNRHLNGRVENLPTGSLDISVSKSFAEGRWNVQLGVYDIFRTDRRIQNSWIGEDQNFTNFLGDTRYLRLSISRSFGKLKSVNYDHSNVGEGEVNRAY